MKIFSWIKRNIHYPPLCIISNFLLLYVCYMICRIEFTAFNWQLFSGKIDFPLAMNIIRGGIRFDTAAIIYTNLPYLLLVLLPLHYKRGAVMTTVTKWVFVVVNALAIIVNLMDSVYFEFSQRRTTLSILDEFGDNTNLGSIIGIELVNRWYLVVLAAVMIYGLWRLYMSNRELREGESLKRYYIRTSVTLVILAPILVMGMRGNTFFRINRPISTTEANEYVNEPAQAGIVMNTPFAIVRASGRKQIKIPTFYDDEGELKAVFTAVHLPSDSATVRQKNVVILLLESMAEEFIGAMYRPESGDSYETLTPFIDSLYTQSLTFEHSYANGWLSTDGIPVIQSSMPRLCSPHIISPYALDEMPGIAKELNTKGYTTAYFHGAEDSSLGLKASSRSTGFAEYYGMNEYLSDSRFGGDADYDGTWGIYDEEFMQYVCAKLSEFKQPFYATCFSVTAHHPFSIPKRYKDVFYDKEPEHPIKKCISYTDWAVRQFFATAQKQPWYSNTIFVILADHAYRKGVRDSYRNYNGYYRIPIMFYDPSGEMPRGPHPGISQQIDIMPTLLSYLGYDKPYAAIGQDLLNTPPEQTWAFQFQDFPQMFKGDYMIEMKDYKLSGVYRFKEDFQLKHNLYPSGDYDHAQVDSMVRLSEAILQTMDRRLKDNTLRSVE